MAIGAYSDNVALSGYGALTGLKVEGGTVGGMFHSPFISLSTGGGGINIFNSRTGIYKRPEDYYGLSQKGQVVLDVGGDTWIAGSLTITGDLSALGNISYLDTNVTVTSAFKVYNTGTAPAATIIQSGSEPILQCFDSDISTAIPSFIVDGATNGWVGLGVATPTAPFNIVKSSGANELGSANQPHIRIFDGTTNKIIAGTYGTNNGGTNAGAATNPYIGTENAVPFDLYTNNQQRVSILSNGNVGIDDAGARAKVSVFANDATSNYRAISAYGTFIGAELASPMRGLSAYGGYNAGEFYSDKRALSGWGGIVGIDISSPNTALSAWGGAYGAIIAGGVTRINYDGGGSTYINTNNGLAATTVAIGNTLATLTTLGTTTINNNAGTNTTGIGTGTTTGKITIGNTGLTGGVEVDGATVSINDNAGTYVTNIATTGTSGAVSIANGTATSNVSIGNSTGSNTLLGNPVNINVDNSTDITNIGTGTTSGAVNIATGTGNVSVGNATGSLTVNGNAGTITTASTLGVTTGSTVSVNTTTGRALNINNGTAATTNINTGAGAVTTTIGNAGTVAVAGSTAVTLTGPTTINANAGTNTTGINTGTTTGNIQIGNTTGSTTALVGIGTSPSVRLDISNNATVPSAATGTTVHVTQTDSANNRILVDSFGLVAVARPAFTGRHAANTAASPSAVLLNDVLCEFTGQGYGATGYSSTSRGRMTIRSAEGWTDTAQGTYLAYETTTIGGVSTTEKVRINDTGSLLVGTTTDSGKLTVNGSISLAGTTNATVNINTGASGNAATNIATTTNSSALGLGNSSGATNINGSTVGATAASTLDLTSGSTLTVNSTTARTTNINTGAGAVTTTIGSAGTVAINGTTNITGTTTVVGATNVNTGASTTANVGINTGSTTSASTTNIHTGAITGALGLGNTSAATNISGSTITLNSGGSNNVSIGTATAGTMLTVNGPIASRSPNTPVISANAYTVATTDSSLIISNGTTTVTLTLPAPASFPGRWLYIKNITACTVNSAASNVSSLAGVTGTAILTNTAGKFAALHSDGSNWITMMAN